MHLLYKFCQGFCLSASFHFLSPLKGLHVFRKCLPRILSPGLFHIILESFLHRNVNKWAECVQIMLGSRCHVTPSNIRATSILSRCSLQWQMLRVADWLSSGSCGFIIIRIIIMIFSSERTNVPTYQRNVTS